MTALTWYSFSTIYAETETQQRPEEHSLVRNSREGLVFYRVRNVIASYHSYISRTRTSQPTFGISEDGLEEVCLGDWKDSSRATILWHSFFFFVRLKLNAELYLENYLELDHNDCLISAFSVSCHHDQRITLIYCCTHCHFQNTRLIHPWFVRLNA